MPEALSCCLSCVSPSAEPCILASPRSLLSQLGREALGEKVPGCGCETFSVLHQPGPSAAASSRVLDLYSRSCPEKKELFFQSQVPEPHYLKIRVIWFFVSSPGCSGSSRSGWGFRSSSLKPLRKHPLEILSGIMGKHPEVKSGDMSAFPDPYLKHILSVVLARVTE